MTRAAKAAFLALLALMLATPVGALAWLAVHWTWYTTEAGVADWVVFLGVFGAVEVIGDTALIGLCIYIFTKNRSRPTRERAADGG